MNRIVSSVIACTVLCFLPFSSRAGSSQASCGVELVVPHKVPDFGSFTPRLISHRPSVIFVSHSFANPSLGSYVVEKAKGTPSGDSSLTIPLADFVGWPGPDPFLFSKPEGLPIDYSAVETVRETQSIIPAGRYRMRLVFSLSDPNYEKGPTIKLCTVYSNVFEVTGDSGVAHF